jgi:hypothetical protein
MILNKTTKHRDRHRILPGNMGNAGDPKDSPNHTFHIAYGINRGNGYQGSMSVTYFFGNESHAPEEAKQNAVKFLLANGYENWLRQKELI